MRSLTNVRRTPRRGICVTSLIMRSRRAVRLSSMTSIAAAAVGTDVMDLLVHLAALTLLAAVWLRDQP